MHYDNWRRLRKIFIIIDAYWLESPGASYGIGARKWILTVRRAGSESSACVCACVMRLSFSCDLRVPPTLKRLCRLVSVSPCDLCRVSWRARVEICIGKHFQKVESVSKRFISSSITKYSGGVYYICLSPRSTRKMSCCEIDWLLAKLMDWTCMCGNWNLWLTISLSHTHMAANGCCEAIKLHALRNFAV